ncbi:hypothetical protein OH77DRAFT_1429522 [Trametes cingulata]|nr:hypothetical protein OH77DRAFT_1429522 [Trametes cingulata]
MSSRTRSANGPAERAAKRQRMIDGEESSPQATPEGNAASVGSSDTAPTDEDTAVARDDHSRAPPSGATSSSGGEGNQSVQKVTDLNAEEWMSLDLIDRLKDFVTFSEKETNRYAVSTVPSSARWGVVGGAKDLDRYLCVGEKPVLIWLVGTVASKWFANRMGRPQEKVNIGIVPLRQKDYASATSLLAKSKPSKAYESPNIYASRFMTEWSDTDESTKVATFDKIYDATNGFGRKSDLPMKRAHQIGVGDVVLVEAALTRYKTGLNKWRWEEWKAQFELHSVCILAEKPCQAPRTESFFSGDEADTTL